MLRTHVPDEVRDQLAALPSEPGVYLLHDEVGDLLYVGKAVNLRNRVRSYFRPRGGHSAGTRQMVPLVARIETVVTGTEDEALALEHALIKGHRPRFNVLLTDDATYPYAKLTLDEPFPRLVVTRVRASDGGRYFGPYTDVWAVRALVEALHRAFPLRRREHPQHRDRPCLNHALGRCLAPCQGLVDEDGYAALVADVAMVLEGRHDLLLERLEDSMHAAARREEFERAARLRDQARAIAGLRDRLLAVGQRGDERDVVGVAVAGDLAAVHLVQIRAGRLLAGLDFRVDAAGAGPAEVLAAFLGQYYAGTDQVPREVLVPRLPSGARVLARWLTQRKRSRVALEAPAEGHLRVLVETAERQAMAHLARLQHNRGLPARPELA